jgi:acyl-CoA hydrolase
MQLSRCSQLLKRCLPDGLRSELSTNVSPVSLATPLTAIRPGRKAKWMQAEEAVECIKSNDHVYVQMAAGTPTHMIRALSAHCRKHKLNNVHVHQMLTMGDCHLPDAENEGVLRGNSLFTAAFNREQIAIGRHDYTPVNLSDIGQVFLSGQIKPKVSILQLSPADRHGFHSFGPTVIAATESLQVADIRIGQVNAHCPRTLGGTVVHESQMDILVRHDDPLPQLVAQSPNDIEMKIGRLVAEQLISNGSTLQIGIGSIPEAVLGFLHHHQQLGLHTEMASDGVIELIRGGIIDNSLKKLDNGRSTLTFALGTRALYDFIDDNPSFEFRPCSQTNDVSLIRRNPKPIAINSCLEIDLSGQAASDMIGPNVYSGFGGQLDFLRGAAIADDGQGKAILAFVSQTNKGKSKIVPQLKVGARVVATRTHVQYVVTEHGIAELFGKSLRQRAYELIQVAHPDHREWLEQQAFEQLKCLPSRD